MGVEMFLVRVDNKTLFELGKTRTGFDYAFTKYRISSKNFDIIRNSKHIEFGLLLPDQTVLVENLVQAATYAGDWADSSDDFVEFAQKLAKRLTDWADSKKVFLVLENEGDELRLDHGFKITADRYIKD